jgi:NADP-dependent 3-hydroxy acid dehydrogenase YdfG
MTSARDGNAACTTHMRAAPSCRIFRIAVVPGRRQHGAAVAGTLFPALASLRTIRDNQARLTKKGREPMISESLRAIVTGAASGLGAAIARGLAGAGAKLVLNYGSNSEGAKAVATACRASGAEAVTVQGDVSVDGDCHRIVDAAQGWGGLDILINNAGVTRHVDHANLDGLDAADFQRIFAVNSIGPYQMIRAARPLLEAAARERGRASAVVNISSIAGLSGIGSSVAYVASKGALNAIDPVALPRAGTGDPGQCGLSRLYRH